MTGLKPARLGTPVISTALACALGLGAPVACAAQAARSPEPIAGVSVQFTDKLLRTPEWRRALDRAAALGVGFVRVDLNWDWVETEPGRYAWGAYDEFAAALVARKLRPVFILNRPNPLHGRSLPTGADGHRGGGVAPPERPDEVAAFARWAAAAAVRFRAARPVWEIWNEPDQDGFWPPRPDPDAYLALARATCTAIRSAVPDAVVTGPAAAQMPTVWDGSKPLVAAVYGDQRLTRCLDAVSLHTHRFGQAPETVGRDYAVLRRVTAQLPGANLPLLDTEWGDTVARGRLSEDEQARWLPRMILVNLLEGVRFTNWYCLVDTGDNSDEAEDRFGLVTRSGRLRPAYRALQVLTHALSGLSLRQALLRFDPATAQGATVLLFCGPGRSCKLAAWTTEGSGRPQRIDIAGWTLTGPITGHLGTTLPHPPQRGSSATLDVSPDVQFVAVRPSRNGSN